MKRVSSILTGYLVRLLPFIILLSCISPIDFEVKNSNGQIVISGRISTLEGRTLITVGATSEGALPAPISYAKVQIVSETGDIYNLYEKKYGEYTADGFSALPGVSYKVRVQFHNGSTYESVPEIVSDLSAPVSVRTEFVDEAYTNLLGGVLTKHFLKLYASTNLPDNLKDKYIYWSVEEVFILSPTDYPDPFGRVPPPCYIIQKAEANRIALLDGNSIQTGAIENQLVCSRLVDRTFLERHYFNTYQASITKEAHDYLTKVNILANQTGSIFDTPPAKISGNISNINNKDEPVWGYVQSVNETYDRFFMVPGSFPYDIFFPLEDCTFQYGKQNYPSYCENCLLFRNSSYEKPDWF
jgi:hypothetical protein